VTCFDRNFPSHELITAILDAAAAGRRRLAARRIPHELAERPSGKEEDRLPVRVTEHNVIMPRDDGTEGVSQTCTVITTLLDHQAAPADAVRETYLTRWSASETSKPHCCHMYGWLALPSVPSGSVFVRAA